MTIRENFGKPIDPHIGRLVEAMNVPGVCETIASCEGHRDGWLTGAIRPSYVYFRATLRFAAEMNKLVYGDACLADSQLNYYWHLRAMFNHEHSLVFTLSIPDYDRPVRLDLMDFRGLKLWRHWSRARLDADFETLRGFVSTALAQLRQEPVPEVDQGNARQCHQERGQECLFQPSFGAWPERAGRHWGAAARTHVGIRTHRIFTVPALDEFRLHCFPPFYAFGNVPENYGIGVHVHG